MLFCSGFWPGRYEPTSQICRGAIHRERRHCAITLGGNRLILCCSEFPSYEGRGSKGRLENSFFGQPPL